MKGFSVSNLKYGRHVYQFYSDAIRQQPVAQLQPATIPANTQAGQISQQPVDQLQPATIPVDTQAGQMSQQPVDQFVQQVVAQIPWGITLYKTMETEIQNNLKGLRYE